MNALILALRNDREPGEFIVLQLIRERDFPFVDMDAACKKHMMQTNSNPKIVDGKIIPNITPVYKAVWWVDAQIPEGALDNGG